jgi:hypothetical protein
MYDADCSTRLASMWQSRSQYARRRADAERRDPRNRQRLRSLGHCKPRKSRDSNTVRRWCATHVGRRKCDAHRFESAWFTKRLTGRAQGPNEPQVWYFVCFCVCCKQGAHGGRRSCWSETGLEAIAKGALLARSLTARCQALSHACTEQHVCSRACSCSPCTIWASKRLQQASEKHNLDG